MIVFRSFFGLFYAAEVSLRHERSGIVRIAFARRGENEHNTHQMSSKTLRDERK